MRDKKNAPEIRFKGFWEPWEENTFNNLAEYKKGPFGSSLTKSIFVPKSTNAMKVYEQQNAICKNWKLERYFITKSYANKMSSFEVRGGDIIVSCAGTIGATYILPDDAVTGIINQALMRIRVNDVIIDKKLFIYLFTNMIDDFSKIHSNGSAIKNIPPFSDLKPTKVLIPNIKEQSKLIVFLSKIDDLIKFQQQKLEKLKNIKKSMLDKMFPKNGNTIPEIRFKGFLEPWEYHELNHYLKTSTDKNLDELYDKSDVLSVSGEFGIVNQIEFQGRSFAGVSVANYGIVKVGDVVYTKSPLNSNPYGIIKTNKIKTGIVSTLYAVYHPHSNVFSDFIQVYYEQNARVNNYLHPLVNKGAKNDMKISDDNALKGIVIFPDYKEQKCIANFFDAIDILINLYHCKLKKLKKIKKSMLDKMFV